jgi:hypothetical protein
MSEAIPPLPNTPSWRGAQLKHSHPSPQHGASSVCLWISEPPEVDVIYDKLNKQSRTADKGGPPRRGLGRRLTTPYYKNTAC